jgi:hypothetical protein
MAKTWRLVRVDLLSGGRIAALWPRPGRVFLVGPAHTFADLATAIDDAFARWDHSHLHEFTLQDGRRIGLPDDDGDVLDGTGLKVLAEVGDAPFRYVFDLGDDWTHRCEVEPEKIDPTAEYGAPPPKVVPVFGWGTIPDQYGRRWADDDGEGPEPARPKEPDPMSSWSWPD